MSLVDLGKVMGCILPGDSFANQTLLAYGLTSNSNKTLDICIPIDALNITSFTCTRLNLRLKSAKGGSVPSNNFDAIASSDVTIDTLIVRKNGLIIRLINTNAWANIDNETICAGTITFSGVFS